MIKLNTRVSTFSIRNHINQVSFSSPSNHWIYWFIVSSTWSWSMHPFLLDIDASEKYSRWWGRERIPEAKRVPAYGDIICVCEWDVWPVCDTSSDTTTGMCHTTSRLIFTSTTSATKVCACMHGRGICRRQGERCELTWLLGSLFLCLLLNV